MNKKLFHIVSDEAIFQEKHGTFYLGIDPTAAGAHIGHLISLRLGIELLNNGFQGIILIGGFTGKIGDPTDKTEARKKLNTDQASDFGNHILNDIKHIFEPYKEKITYVNNKDWLDQFTLSDYLNLSYHISISRKIHLETFDNRLRNNLNLSGAEFMYPDVQMIDFLHLANNHGCNIQLGGQDQWGNISYGVHYVKKITDRDDIYGICTPLLTSNNKKISKSEGKPPFLKNPFDLYQFCMQTTDDTIQQMYDIFLPNITLDNDNIQVNRKKIAHEIISIAHPKYFQEIFDKIESDSQLLFYETNIEKIPNHLLQQVKPTDVISIINELDNNISKSELKRKISEGAVSINGVKILENVELNNGKYRITLGSKRVFCIIIDDQHLNFFGCAQQ
jgi:tyrosyl-tRNA synthetase